MYIQNKYIQLHNSQSLVINLMKVSVFDLVKPSMVYISHLAHEKTNLEPCLVISTVYVFLKKANTGI